MDPLYVLLARPEHIQLLLQHHARIVRLELTLEHRRRRAFHAVLGHTQAVRPLPALIVPQELILKLMEQSRALHARMVHTQHKGLHHALIVLQERFRLLALHHVAAALQEHTLAQTEHHRALPAPKDTIQERGQLRV